MQIGSTANEAAASCYAMSTTHSMPAAQASPPPLRNTPLVMGMVYLSWKDYIWYALAATILVVFVTERQVSDKRLGNCGVRLCGFAGRTLIHLMCTRLESHRLRKAQNSAVFPVDTDEIRHRRRSREK